VHRVAFGATRESSPRRSASRRGASQPWSRCCALGW